MTRFLAAEFCTVICVVPLPAFAHSDTGVGRPGESAQVTRTVAIGMADSMRFAPGELVVARGQTVKIIARNDGKVQHEIVLGTPAEIIQHRESMQRDPHLAHGAPNMAHVAPGESEQLIWQFAHKGKFEFACLLPGHYEAGMSGTIVVQ